MIKLFFLKKVFKFFFILLIEKLIFKNSLIIFTILFSHLFVLWLRDSDDSNRAKSRQEITQTILNEKGVDQFIIEMTGNLFQDRFLNMINYGDWLSYWCAIAHNTDPSPVDNIVRLKKELMKRS